MLKCYFISILLTSTKTCSRAVKRDWGEGVSSFGSSAELGKKGGDGNFGKIWKRRNHGLYHIGKRTNTPIEFLFFAGTVPNFFTCAIAFTSQTNTKKVSTFIPIIHMIKLKLRKRLSNLFKIMLLVIVELGFEPMISDHVAF